MIKNILVLSSSPRKGGNSDTLCVQFIKGAKESGNITEKIYIHDKKINWCNACYACKKTETCVQNDDMSAIIEKMVNADIIVLATPVYYYTMSAQLKTLIDRCLPLYTKIRNKDFYFIATAAEEKEKIERTIDGLRSFAECLPGAQVKGIIYGAGVWQLGDIKKNSALQEEAYQAGKNA
jgi:multimeric flavodoxin WrbA